MKHWIGGWSFLVLLGWVGVNCADGGSARGSSASTTLKANRFGSQTGSTSSGRTSSAPGSGTPHSPHVGRHSHHRSGGRGGGGSNHNTSPFDMTTNKGPAALSGALYGGGKGDGLPMSSGRVAARGTPMLADGLHTGGVPPADTRPQTVITDAQQQNIEKLLDDLSEFRQGLQVTQQQRDEFQKTLRSFASSERKPADQSLTRLASDLQNFWAYQQLDVAQQRQLAGDIAAVLGTVNLRGSEVRAALQDAQRLLQASGVDKQNTETLLADLRAIVTELASIPQDKAKS